MDNPPFAPLWELQSEPRAGDLPLFAAVDVLVAGGGPAGVAAAT
jgi:NADPH-dependent 2,4-dienoyl-CoA reductase/sulfur reductase-like enzyme